MSALLEESHNVPPLASSSTSSQPAPPPPIESYQLRQVICGIETELLVQTFDDRVLVVVTQNGKVGCLTQASLPAQIPLPPPPPAPAPASTPTPSSLHILSILPPPPAALLLTPLLGSPPDTTLHDLYISQIATLVFFALESASNNNNGRRPVVVGLSLKRIGGGGIANQDNGIEDTEGEGGGLSDAERARYAGIMGLVSQWPGPGPSN
ncbi:hypothetical protein I316_00313 [Kwoniella heveanensis BCC8398]|uniref:Proteasome assembly chaperone 3 n=1 Tax=Kwoniella heveanensis BCC8398 TaxID=1296120 RepID=A0A1B9H4A0_9TREE|nr:hypothetical protein I316_00313 [Kwoniella heveanensis BCC8398]